MRVSDLWPDSGAWAVEAVDGMYPGVLASCGVLGDHIDEGQERRKLVGR
jgi:hypothetical protein